MCKQDIGARRYTDHLCHIYVIGASFVLLRMQVASVGIYEKFASAFVKAVQSLQVGNGLEESTSQVYKVFNPPLLYIELQNLNYVFLVLVAWTMFSHTV